MSGAVGNEAGPVDDGSPLLPPTANPRPEGDGWRLIEYNWALGIGTLQYRRVGSGEKRTVRIQQPAHAGHAGWNDLHPLVRRAKGAAAAEAARFRPERAGRRPPQPRPYAEYEGHPNTRTRGRA